MKGFERVSSILRRRYREVGEHEGLLGHPRVGMAERQVAKALRPHGAVVNRGRAASTAARTTRKD